MDSLREYLNECIIVISLYYFELANRDVSYLKLRISEIPYDTDGNPELRYKHKFGGCLIRHKCVVINPKPQEAILYYGGIIPQTSLEWGRWFILITAHEMAHELYFIAEDSFRQNLIESARKENFSTSYLVFESESISIQKYEEELFAEYLASMVVNSERFLYLIKQFESRYIKKWI